MTARCCSCNVDLEGMRLARAEDHKACARLTARVKELEESLECMRASRNQLSRQLSEVTVEKVVSLAEGTRDETAARCASCRVPSAAYDHLGRCGMCASEVPP